MSWSDDSSWDAPAAAQPSPTVIASPVASSTGGPVVAAQTWQSGTQTPGWTAGAADGWTSGGSSGGWGSSGSQKSNAAQLIIAHGICMTLAWMAFLSTGILIARFFRGHLASHQPFGTKMWFHGHRILQLIGIALTICGFMCVLAAEGWKWSGPKAGATTAANKSWGSVHAMVGLLSCIIAWAQPLNALFRCHPDAERRSIFNWIHRCLGFGAWLLAAAALLIACVHFKDMFTNQRAALAFMIVFVVAFGIALIALQALQSVGDARQRKGGADMEMVVMDGKTRVVPAATNSAIRKIQAVLFVPYIVVSWVSAIVICFLIGLK